MSKKYTYSRKIETREGKESFSAVEFDSFDEAIKAVDRGIADRQIQIKRTLPITQSQPNNAEIRKDTTAGPGVGTSTTPATNH